MRGGKETEAKTNKRPFRDALLFSLPPIYVVICSLPGVEVSVPLSEDHECSLSCSFCYM